MKQNWMRFVSLFMALALVIVSGIVVTTKGFKASNDSTPELVKYDGVIYDVYEDEGGAYILVAESIYAEAMGIEVEEEIMPLDLEEAEEVVADEADVEDAEAEDVDTEEEVQPEETTVEEAAPAEETPAEEAPAEEAPAEEVSEPVGALVMDIPTPLGNLDLEDENYYGNGLWKLYLQYIDYEVADEKPATEPSEFKVYMKALGQDGETLGTVNVVINEDGTFEAPVVANSYNKGTTYWIPARVESWNTGVGTVQDNKENQITYSGIAREFDEIIVSASMGNLEGVSVEDDVNNPIIVLDMEKNDAATLFNSYFEISAVSEGLLQEMKDGKMDLMVVYLPCKIANAYNLTVNHKFYSVNSDYESTGEVVYSDTENTVLYKSGNIGRTIYSKGYNDELIDRAPWPHKIVTIGDTKYRILGMNSDVNTSSNGLNAQVQTSDPFSQFSEVKLSIEGISFPKTSEESIPIYEDVTVEIEYIVQQLTSYTIYQVDEDGNNIFDPAVIFNVPVGTEDVTAGIAEGWVPKEINKGGIKYTYKGGDDPITLVADPAQNIIKLVYTSEKAKNPQYKVTLNQWVLQPEGVYNVVNVQNGALENGKITSVDADGNPVHGITSDKVKVNGKEIKISQITVNNEDVTFGEDGKPLMQYSFLADNMAEDMVIDIYYDPDYTVPAPPVVDTEDGDDELVITPNPTDTTPTDTTPTDTTPADTTPADNAVPEAIAPIEPVAEPEAEPVIEIVPAPVNVPADGTVPVVAITTGENGEGLTFTQIDDLETALANQDLGHICNILYFLILLATSIILYNYFRNTRKHQERIFELRNELGEDDPYRKNR